MAKNKIYFENIRIYRCDFYSFKRGAALALPPFGIVVGSESTTNKDLIRHEFGHFLQYRKWGFFMYWFRISFVSLFSALKENKNKSFYHYNTWTEWSANYLSYLYFEEPKEWNLNDYPILPKKTQKHSLPCFEKNISVFIIKWIRK